MNMTARIGILSAVILCAMGVIFSPQAKAAQTMTADESKIAAMFSDEKITPEEKKEIAEIMKAGECYGMKVKLNYKNEKDTAARIFYTGSTPDRMETISERLGDTFYSKTYTMNGAQVWLWHNPSPEVEKSAQATAKAVIQKIYDDITAIKDKYSELAKFDKDHVKISNNSLHYAPNPAHSNRTNRKISSPTISVSLGEPSLGGTPQMMSVPVFPAQKLELIRFIAAEDEELSKRIRDIITRDIEPLIQAEIALGSYPVGIRQGP